MIPINLQSEIQFVLAQPLVFELYGAGFSRRRGSSLYELRFPRVSAIHEFRRPSEAVTLSELQSLAKESLSWIGSEAESEVDDMWSKHSSASGGETSGDSATDWRARQQEHWVKKLTRACQPRTGRRSRRLQQTDHNGSYPAQTMLDPTGVAEDAACSEDIHHETGNENGFNEQQPYLWTCLPYQIAPRILLPTSYRVASLESLLFMVSSLRKISAPVQAVILLEEPLSSDGVTWIQELVRNWHEDGSDLRQTSQVWLHPLPNLNDEPEYRVEALNVATMRVLTRPN